jgi:soluble lytic murein transglycosylase-like protein
MKFPWWVLGLAALAVLSTGGIVAVAYWKQSQNAQKWLPSLSDAEIQYGIPTDLLARMAYQETHFTDANISGTNSSPAGALGLMQLEPQYFASVRRPIPFSDSDTLDQIAEAAQELARLHGVFNSWQWAVAAYNDGQGNIQQVLAGNRSLPVETSDYLSAVFGDVPSALNA